MGDVERLPRVTLREQVRQDRVEALHVRRGQAGSHSRAGADAPAPLGVMTFSPHPRRYFRPDDAPFELTPAAGKERQLALLGADVLFALPFDEVARRLDLPSADAARKRYSKALLTLRRLWKNA